MLISEEELERRAAELRGRLSEWEWGYLTAFLEGDGSLTINYIKRAKKFYPGIVIGNINFNVLYYFFKKLWMGSISKSSTGKSTIYRWSIYGREALIILRILFPWLTSCKKIKAALLLALRKCNKGVYAKKLKQKVEYLNNHECELIFECKKPGGRLLKNYTQFEAGFIAGLLESEGSISIGKTSMVVTIDIYNTCARLISGLLKMAEGGKVYFRPRPPPYRNYYSWAIRNRDAEALLFKIKDYLMIKREQAILALKYIETLGTPRKRLSYDILEQRKLIYEKVKALNHKGRR